MDTSRCIQSCNPARFVITFALLIFSILFALRIDGYIKINYWFVFLPLFLWKILVIFGACTGIFIWCKSDESNRIVRSPDNDCRELILYFLLHIFIFIFELLICDKLENHLEIRWIICFSPLLLCIFLSFISCLWSLKAQKSFLIQAFITINGLFFLFFPLRLDYFLTWRYTIVFIPVWISLSIALLFVVSKFILAIIHRCSHRLLVNQHELSTFEESFMYAMIFIPFSIFLILLINRLDNNPITKLSYTVISIPLWITLISWLSFSFGANDCNPLWFGLQRNLCEIVLGQYPCLSLYFNNKYKFPSNSTTNDLFLNLTTEKTLEPFNLTKLSSIEMINEKNLTKKYSFISIFEPD